MAVSVLRYLTYGPYPLRGAFHAAGSQARSLQRLIEVECLPFPGACSTAVGLFGAPSNECSVKQAGNGADACYLTLTWGWQVMAGPPVAGAPTGSPGGVGVRRCQKPFPGAILSGNLLGQVSGRCSECGHLGQGLTWP